MEESNYEIRTYETGGAGYEDGFFIEIYWGFHIVDPFASSSIPNKFPFECAE